jgi:hypothetical protein
MQEVWSHLFLGVYRWFPDSPIQIHLWANGMRDLDLKNKPLKQNWHIFPPKRAGGGSSCNLGSSYNQCGLFLHRHCLCMLKCAFLVMGYSLSLNTYSKVKLCSSEDSQPHQFLKGNGIPVALAVPPVSPQAGCVTCLWTHFYYLFINKNYCIIIS